MSKSVAAAARPWGRTEKLAEIVRWAMPAHRWLQNFTVIVIATPSQMIIEPDLGGRP